MEQAKVHFLGIDGGGSRCRARIRDAAGHLLGEAIGGSSNIYQNFEGALANIVATAAEAASKAKLKTTDLHAGLGLAGIVTSVGAERITTAKLPFASVIADNDAYAACVGAFAGGDGGIVIAGTGSIGFAAINGVRHMVGGWGFALGTQAYKRTYFHSSLYFSGTWLFNPRDTTNVPTFRTRKYEGVMSVSDQYLWRGGISHAVPRVKGLVASIGGRMEGVPVRDAFGQSNGFRRPGYAISVDPGFLYSRGRYLFSGNVPFAVERNRKISVPDMLNHTHGDAAFADYTLNFSVSRRF